MSLKQKYKLHKGKFAEIDIPQSGRCELSKKVLAAIGTGAVLLTLLVAPGTVKLLKLFNIPEKHKKAREALRHNLHRLGFYPLQRSVFAYPYSCKDEIDFVSEFFAVGNFVNYFEANYFDDDSKLKLHFQDLLD